MNETILGPVLFFGGGALMVAALSLTMTVLRLIAQIRIHAFTPLTHPTSELHPTDCPEPAQQLG